MARPRPRRVAPAPPARPRARAPRAEAAEATREAMLDAAEQLLREGGSEAVRLQDIAAQVGVTHPAVLYHFKNRDGLLAALFQRSSTRMREALLAEVLRPPAPGAAVDPADLFVRVYDRVVDAQRAPLLAWLLACGQEPFPADEEAGLAAIADRLHALRRHADPRAADDLEGTRFGLMALTLLMFGDLLLGGATRRRLGLRDDAATRDRYRRWLGARLPAMIAALDRPRGAR